MLSMRISIVLIAIMALFGCQENSTPEVTESDHLSFFVGTYTDGESKGIYLYHLKEDGKLEKGKLMAQTANPSFLAMSKDKNHLLAVNELDSGTIESYNILEDTLSLVNQSATGGAHPCFVTINDTGYVLTANYSGGNTGLLHLDKNGKLSPLMDTLQHFGKSITERQQGPHAHSAWFIPQDQGIVSVDLGTNELWFSSIKNNQLLSGDPARLALTPGAGPRHLTFHPNGKWIYVVNELNSTVSLVEKETPGNYALGASWSTLPEGYEEQSYCADIHISSDGRFVYASNRGHNSIAIFSVHEETGALTYLGYVSVRGNWPRNFAFSPDENYLLVANQHSNNITSFKKDKKTGLLEFVHEVEAPNPVCIVFK